MAVLGGALPETGLAQPALTDGTVSLRAWTLADADALTAVCQDPDVVAWTRVPADYSRRDALARIDSAERGRLAGTGLHYAVVGSGTGALLGAIDIFVRGTDPGVAEVAYLLAASARGHGVMTRAVGLLTGYALTELGVRRIELLHHPDNARSEGVARRAGFQREGLLRGYRARPPGAAEDRVLHALLANDPRLHQD